MPSVFSKAMHRLASYRYLPQYWWHHKVRFGVTNTKFDISWLVFSESFIKDQYDIRRFLDRAKHADTLFFLDIGRNHGFVFLYMMDYIKRSGFKAKVVNYVGVDPAPLKFAYFNDFEFLRQHGIQINYHLIDKAVVYSDHKHVKLKYGENNFGNFNVDESNYARKRAALQNRFSYIEINVETLNLDEIRNIVRENKSSDAMIVKIDCKNQTTRLFTETLELLGDYDKPYLIACEKDASGDRDMSIYAKPGFNTLTHSNLFGTQGPVARRPSDPESVATAGS